MAAAHPNADPAIKLKRTITLLEYAYEDRPDDESPERQQWEFAFANKVNTLAHQLLNLDNAIRPRALPPLTVCSLYLHNIRSGQPNGVFNFSELRPVHAKHPALTDSNHVVGVAADFGGNLYPLFARDKVKTDWWKTAGT